MNEQALDDRHLEQQSPLVSDPVKAEQMANAEDPHREEEKKFGEIALLAQGLSGVRNERVEYFERKQKEAGIAANEAGERASEVYEQNIK